MKKISILMLIGMLLPMLAAAQTDLLWLNIPTKTNGLYNLYSDLSKKDPTELVIEKELAQYYAEVKRVKVTTAKVANIRIFIDKDKTDNLGEEGFKIRR